MEDPRKCAGPALARSESDVLGWMRTAYFAETERKWTNNAIWRAHDRAMERGAVVYAIAQADMHSLQSHEFFRQRLRVVLEELIYEFAFNARRAIECADSEKKGLILFASNLAFVRGAESFRVPGVDQEIALCQESYWWVLNRIVHSRATVVLPHGTEVRRHANDQDRTSAGRSFAVGDLGVFAVRSDRDVSGGFNFVRVDHFVSAYLDDLAPRVEEVTNALTMAELGVRPESRES